VAAILQECPRLLAQLETAIAEGDHGQVHRLAHTLKGSTRVLAVEPVQQLSGTLEAAGAEHRLDAARRLLESLRAELEPVLAELRFYAGDSANNTT
jgi:HPt (histidine-containing phosphotransfer) domain-containing protein